MRVLSCLLLVVAAEAITVPPAWHRGPTPRPRPSRGYYPNRNVLRQPQKVRQPPVRPVSPSDWIPVTPAPYINQHQHYIVHQPPITRPSRFNYISHADKNVPFSPITGSRINLAPAYNPGPDFHLSDEHLLPNDDDPVKSTYNSPVSEHEYPKDIPTKPIYPGPGLWAKPALKHKPHFTPHHFRESTQEEQPSDGYDIFERGQDRFKEAQNQFKQQKETLRSKANKEESEDEEESEEKEAQEFIPQKLYAQVRKTETTKHLPRSKIDPEEEENADKLREIIRDSKIQTVYSEEGYEDSAYDHAGKEKKAESQEGHLRKSEEAETAGKRSNGNKHGQHFEKRGHNRGHAKHRRTKNKNQTTKTDNFDNAEEYHAARKKVEQENSDTETAASEHAIKYPLNNNSVELHTTKQQKIEIKSTMKNGDDVNMEIHTEVKFVNGGEKKKHKFVRIVPSYKRVVEPDTYIADSGETVDSKEEVSHRRVKRYDREKLAKKYVRKRPNYYWKRKKTNTTKVTHHSSPVTIRVKTRQKRYTLDFPNIDVPTVKLVDIKDLSSSNTEVKENAKYPYFEANSKILNENSPLRYAENLDSIPNKSGDKMAFYKSRSKISCADIPDDIDPVPDRIKNKKSNDDVDGEDKKDHENTGPRLEGLGDKIDCLKVKYFGEDPLDSPIFKEETINLPVPAIFKKGKDNHKKVVNVNHKIKLDEAETKEDLSSVDALKESKQGSKKSNKRDVSVLTPIFVVEEDTNTTINPITIQSNAVLRPPYTFQEIATKLMTNNTPPKSIYDQINLLAEDSENVSGESTEAPNFLIIYENQSNEPNQNKNEGIVEEKIRKINISSSGSVHPKISDVVTGLDSISDYIPDNEIVNLLPDYADYDLIAPAVTPAEENSSLPENTNSNIPETSNVQEENNGNLEETGNSNLPTQAALRNYRFYSQPSSTFRPDSKNLLKNTPTQPKYSTIIFDISKYLPQIKNHKNVASEVQYKDEIKPSEQMNVYSDVLKAINISTQEAQESQQAPSDIAQPITVKLQVANNAKFRNSKKKIRIRPSTPPPHIDLAKQVKDSTIGSSNIRNISKSNIPNVLKRTPQIFPTDAPVTPKILPEKIRNMISQYTNPLIINVPDASQESLEISGLAPPTKFQYRTIKPIFLPTMTKVILKPLGIRLSRNTNNFYVEGLRPPSQQEAMNYNDFKVQRFKRHLDSPQEELLETAESNNEETRARRPIAYTEIVRERKPAPREESEEDEEDLLPRKRTFDIKPRARTTTTEQTLSEEDYFEIEEPAVEKPIPVVYEKPTGLPDYIKLIDRLHEYRFINNITTTLPEQETTTANPRATSTTAKTTTANVPTIEREPAFLQIIKALHDTRKDNEDLNPPTEDESEEVDEPAKPVQNTNPYIVSAALKSSQREGDDESDIQTHIRNLGNKFRTSIDVSKYKTIERAPVVLRHNLSSRYNSEDERLPLERILTTKMPAAFTTTPRIEANDRSSQESRSFPETEDISEEPATSTVKPIRRRGRPRGSRPTTTTRNIESTTSFTVRRRRPQRIQTSSETAQETTTVASIRRRFRQKLEPQTSIKSYVSEIPPNHKREYVPVTEIARNGELREQNRIRPNDINRNLLKKLYERRSEINQNLEEASGESKEENERKEQYEVFAEIKNPNMKHGGNYKHLKEVENNSEEKQSSTRNRFAIRRRPIKQPIETTTQKENTKFEATIVDQEGNSDVKPKIIKDPSKRMYFYAKI